MIELCSAASVVRLFTSVQRRPKRYRSFSAACPFIDMTGIKLLQTLDMLPERLARHLVTRRDAAYPAVHDVEWRNFSVAAIPTLHAKVYVAVGFRDIDHEALITSANLTTAGLAFNLELGTRVTASTAAFARFIERTAGWIASTAANNEMRPRPITPPTPTHRRFL